MQIIPALPEDARGIAEVHVRSWQRAYRDILPADFLSALSVEKRQTMWAESLARGFPEILVAKLNDEIVGFVACGPSRSQNATPDCAEIWAIYLAPEVWGSGFGRALWFAARERLMQKGVRSLHLWVIAANLRAIDFYVAAGFVVDTGPPKHVTLGGAQVEELRYVQSLHATPE